MNTPTTNSSAWQDRTRQRTQQLALWTFLWVLSVAVATFSHILFWGDNILLNLLVIGLNFGIGIKMIHANILNLRAMDELMQKVQLEAMGITLGVVLIAGISFSTLDQTNVIPFDAEIGGLIVLMGLCYLVSVFVLNRKYK